MDRRTAPLARAAGGPARPRLAVLVALALLVVAVTPAGAAKPPGAGKPPPEPPRGDLSFSGYQWAVKSSNGRVGPGPNYFSSATTAVWVDANDRLHLTITKGARNRWYATEVISRDSFGYGTYSWTIASRVDALDKQVVLGLFTWNDLPDYAHREIDYEWAKWGNDADSTNAQVVVQPYDAPGHLERFTQPPAADTTHRFTWEPGRVDFRSSHANGTPYFSWTYAGTDVPVPGGENARMNLWLFRGIAPSDGQAVEIVISDFTHTPLPSP